ncbi:MAG: hypothetical protein POH28_13725 [Acidocella sp.]|nr:hypothetical protein [Acidocella sp.]
MALYNGKIEAITGRVISGKIVITPPPPGPVTVDIFDSETYLGAVVTTAAGDGVYPFEYLLPAALLDGALHSFAARIGEDGIDLHNNAHLLGPTDPAFVRKCVGWLELVSENGVVTGWAWYPDHPTARVELEILVDGAVAATLIADRLRQDVLNAGHGDGKYGFSWPLPFALLIQPHSMTITARDKQTGTALTNELSFRQEFATDAVRRIGELESDIRLLNASLSKLSATRARDQADAANLFKIIGEFFSTLAASDTGPVTSLQDMRLLRPAIAEVTSGFTPFAFRPSHHPALTIFVDVGGPIAGLYTTLQNLAAQLLAYDAEICLLDGNPLGPPCEDAALLPLIIQNLRYVCLASLSPGARYNRAMALAAGGLVMFVGPGVQPGPACIGALASILPVAPIAALAAKIIGPDGYLRSAGVEQRGMAASLRGAASPADTPGFAVPAMVDAATPELFAVRAACWSQHGGFDEAYATPAFALAAFCLALRAEGQTVQYSPAFSAQAPALPDMTDIASQRADEHRLRERIAAYFTPDDPSAPAA